MTKGIHYIHSFEIWRIYSFWLNVKLWICPISFIETYWSLGWINLVLTKFPLKEWCHNPWNKLRVTVYSIPCFVMAFITFPDVYPIKMITIVNCIITSYSIEAYPNKYKGFWNKNYPFYYFSSMNLVCLARLVKKLTMN